jgi:hypothetical protein
VTFPRPFRVLLPAVFVLAVAGCASTPAAASSSPPAAAPPIDAPAAVSRLVDAQLVADPVSTTAASDPNHLLGRPGQYTSRATFTIPGVTSARASAAGPQTCDRGGCVEKWPDEEAANTRSTYIAGIAKQLPAAVEYDFVRPDGLLLRVGGTAEPDVANKVGQAFMAL